MSSEQSVGLLSGMEARNEHLKVRNYRSLYSFATALGVGMLVMVLSWLVKYRDGFSWSDPQLQFNWHPLLMVTGLVFLYGQSILIYRTGRNATKKRLKVTHALLHLSAFILAVIGLKAAFDSHNYAKPPKPNLYTLHSWFGLVAVIIFTGQFVFGFVSFLFPGLSRTLRAAFLPVHVATGIATFTLCVVTALVGITEKTIWTLGSKYQDLPSEGVMVNFIGLFIAFWGILVLYLVNDVDFKRANLPEDEVALSNSNTD
ncbi:transmembrane ascorbate-dependent reductase CYB561 [Tribolium castaneum]|uniref:Cytochrome b561-like Protein n=1 Tax=Tribolium castaneum TaxID=7070 RepID=D2A5D9_TRICA|nr:PREDICTED: cytochrome b561 [Tribolium castaneum]EFA05356.2 Cytochrome b561-like Protein [Tribolium castaneum]|eukprot:XP_008194670.1 PREDICTED: cytochrome b561 [Tribolium castaneum]